MSLELALAANTDALNAVAALHKESNEGRVVALETLKAAAVRIIELPSPRPDLGNKSQQRKC
jgi:hypothetical protein